MIRLAVVMTHPVQYVSPWLRHIASRCPEINLEVVYAVRPSAEAQGGGFGRAFQWDVPLTDGYAHRFVREALPGDDLGRFFGLDAPRVGAELRALRPDVVLSPGWNSVVLLRAILACRAAGIPTLYRGEANAGRRRGLLSTAAWAAKNGAALRLFDGWLSIGRLARQYLRRFRVPERRVFDAPYGVDNAFFAGAAAPFQRDRAAAREAFGLGPSEFVVLFAGKLRAIKRPRDAIEAVARLGDGARLLVVGSGDEEKACRELAEERGVRAVWAGFLNQSAVGRAYAVADCLVLPSEHETWGLVVNEAMATGLPCVVSDRVGCAPDLVLPGETGETFPMGDVAALAHALATVRRRIADGPPYADRCREVVDGYSFEAATAGLLAACRAVTSAAG